MRILVLGTGGVGSAVARIATRRPFFEQCALADYDAHERIYRAIKNGNADSAARACRELIKEALMLVIRSDRQPRG